MPGTRTQLGRRARAAVKPLPEAKPSGRQKEIGRRCATDLERSREALRQVQAYLAEGQRLTSTGSWAWDAKTRENLYWSAEMYRIFELDPTSSGGAFLSKASYRDTLNRVHPDDREEFVTRVDRAIREGKDYERSVRLAMPDGRIKHIQSCGHPVRDDSGEVVEVIGTVMDVTDRKLAEAQLAAERESLREAQMNLARVSRITTVGALTAAIAHEVNQPLAAIETNASACVRWLGATPPNLDEARKAAARIAREGQRAGDIVTRVRALLKKGEPARAMMGVNEVIEEVIAFTQAEATKQNITVELELAVEFPRVFGDRVQIQQVVLNLVMNAIEALAAVADRPRVLSLSTGRLESGWLQVAVRDDGPGLSSEQGQRLFEAFYTTKANGLGMGLSISRSIVEAHGGRLWATPNAGPGVTFKFTLPLEGCDRR